MRWYLALPLFLGGVIATVLAAGFFATWRAPDVSPDNVFELQLGRGDAFRLDIVRITSAGKGTYEYYEPGSGVRRRKHFELDAQTLQGLKEKVRELRRVAIRRKYIDGSKADCGQWRLLIRDSGKTKTVYMSCEFPEPIRQLADFVDQSILTPFAEPAEGLTVPSWHQRKHEHFLRNTVE